MPIYTAPGGDSGGGIGDMTKAVYDSDNDGKVASAAVADTVTTSSYPQLSTDFAFDDDFMNCDSGTAQNVPGWFKSINNGIVGIQQSSFAPSDNLDFGLALLDTGTTLSGTNYATLFTLEVANRIQGGLSCEWRLYAPDAVSDGTTNYTITVGWGDQTSSTEHSNGIYFYYNHGTNSGQWVGKTASATTRTPVNSSVPLAALTPVRLKWTLSANRGTVTFYVNGTSIGTSTTNILTASTFCCPIAKVIKTAGNTARRVHLDYVSCRATGLSR